MSRKRSRSSSRRAWDLVGEVDLLSIHKRITTENFWSDNVWRETATNTSFVLDHDYAGKCSTIYEDTRQASRNVNPSDEKASVDSVLTIVSVEVNTDDSLMDQDLQNNVDISSSNEDQTKHESSFVFSENTSHSFIERRETSTTYTTDDSGIESCDSTFAEDSSLKKTDDQVDTTTTIISKKRNCATKRSRETLISEESPVIEGQFELSRRVTRLQLKCNNEKSTKPTVDNVPGKIVWGCFSSGWWPAIIIKAEDAGMFDNKGKIWVYWIGEKLISQLPEKCVDSFSNELEARFTSLCSTVNSKSAFRKQKEDACSRIIQLLRKEFPNGALIKPYTSWLKINVLPYKDKLDNLLLYPYPKSLEEKLNELKTVNSKKNERYLQDKETTEVKNPTRKVEKPEKPVEEGGIDIMDQKPGMIVWAKIQGYSYWPCVIMEYQHLNKRQPNVAHQWVMWYGDYKYSQIEYHHILQFTAGMKKMESKIRTTKDELFCKAVLRACQDYGEQLEYVTDKWDIPYVTYLFCVSREQLKFKDAALQEYRGEELYSPTIQKQLRKQVKNQPVDETRKQLILECRNLKLVFAKKYPLKSLCISCLKSDEYLEEHPFFYASLCNPCLVMHEDFRPKMFAYGNDAKCFYCSLCGDEDLIAMCDNVDCPRVFCTACIKYIICPEYYEEVLLRHPWYCFLCDQKSIEMKSSMMKVRKDWQARLISLYRINCSDFVPSNLQRLGCNRKIRVLSLFDGIGTGLLVLKNLKIDIDCYYASEIDPDSIQVSFFNYGHEIIQLGDVRNIDDKKIKEIAPIDLLIGGSPCNELSLANPKRRGLDDPEGTGVLFYDYVRIKKILIKYNKKRHLFWLFENVASMPKKFKNQISENLGREPLFLDSADFSAQHRPRLYWGNLPWGPYQVNNVILQDILRKQCKRQALVKKIMTVTTRMNSLNQTKENLKPVLMNGKKDMLWVTELEEIFGFPIHYTDANLQKTRRLQLIGKAWSVQTLVAILRPLFYF
ncbi:DNA (cytosine-5)-methyltransferase 3B-like isoform X2 [Phymastichus coffea]|uniref:DNA (cytosine-5)-methyltransferase 3B-like isoform X2 n=1 Tax=Phymastichus coffea TaxID=108790 RepID=UPI00273C3B22|nr:DNA (cytosine-5)-methyltransferase 3B-like isoform X2 [Phymastichus coffea]